MSPNAAGAADIRLTCQPSKAGNTLVFDYTITNHGPADAYVMDAMPGIDGKTRKPRGNDQTVVVVLGAGDDTIVGKFIAPLPTDRRVAVQTVPLARRLAAGQAFESHVTVALPLAETSPYFADLPLRQYDMVDIRGLLFTIGYWIAGNDGLAALPVEYAPELFSVVTRNTVQSATQVSQRFPTQKLQLFRRADQFPRNVGGWRRPVVDGEPLGSDVHRLSA